MPSSVAGPSSRPPSVENTRKRKKSTPDNEKPHVLSGSGTSLTPPPTSETEVQDLNGEGTPGGRGRKGGRNVQSGPDLNIKIEPDGEGGVDDTPKQVRTNGTRLVPPHSGGTTPTGSVTSDKGTAKSGAGRKRRGEGQLLLDDHLLPEEMRRTGKLTGKRGGLVEAAEDPVEVGKQEERSEAEAPVPSAEQVDSLDQEEESLVTPPPEQSAEGEDEMDKSEQEAVNDDDDNEGEEEGEEGEEVTRCVCQLDGEYISWITFFIDLLTCRWRSADGGV